MSNVVSLHAWKKDISKDDKGKPHKTITNLMRYVRNVIGGDLRYNILADRVEYMGRAIKPSDLTAFRLEFENMRPSFVAPKDDLPNAVEAVAHENAYHPIQEYLENIPAWDKVNRLDTMFHRIFKSPDTPYERAIGQRYMIGAVARAFDPGCKMDNMLILEGAQNAGKSTALQILFSTEYYTEFVGALNDSRRFIEQILGKWCVEFAEFSSLSDAKVDYVKALVSIRNDRTTRNYSRVGATEHPRQCVTAATINPVPGCGYLKDPTGGRRFWPVKCGEIDLEKLTSFRDKLWAEALHRYRAGERWHLTDEEYGLAVAEQEQRQDRDLWQDYLEKMPTKKPLTSSYILYNFLAIDRGKQTSADARRLATVMRKMGWNYSKMYINQQDGERRQVRGWAHPDKTDDYGDG